MNRNGVGTLRKLKIFFITVVCLLASNIAFTLGVGDITVSSGLSQPLDAEIKLFSVRPGEGENIRVTLATLKEFDKVGIDRPLGLSFLKFKVVEKGDGNAYIKVYSERPIREPFLDFLVDIDWPSGRLLREYTLLLDPPIFAQRKAAPVQTPVLAAPARIVREQPAPPVPVVISTPLSVPTAPVVTNNETGLFPQIQIDEELAPAFTSGVTKAVALDAPAFSDDSYKVKESETLWSIAGKVRPDDGISLSQMMIALQQANPEAFSNNNINGLKSGFVLRIPNRADIAAIAHGQALRNSLQQNELWRAAQGNLSGSVTPSGTTTLTKPDTKVVATPKREQASVKLVTPDANAGAAQGAGADSTASAEKLALATEQLASKGKENNELQDRVKSLEDQIGSMERLLELKEDSLSELQNKLTTETSKPVIETAPVVEVTPEPAIEKAPEPVVAEKKPEPVPVVKPIAKEEPKVNPYALSEVPKVKPVPAPKPAEMNWLDDPIILAAIIAVLLAILILVWLVMKRRQNNMQQFPESILSSKPATVSSSKSNDETTLLSDFAPSAMDGAIESDSSEVDPSAEADVYIAYGKHQQAEELLLTSIKEEPDRLDLRLKLMEVYHATGNADSFLTHANHLNGAMDDQNTALWDKAVVMGRELCPGNELFGSDTSGDNEDDFADLQGIADLDDDLDLDLDMGDSLTIEEPEDATADDELSLDMNMDLESLDTSDDEDDGLSLDMGDMGDLTLEIEDDIEETVAETAGPEEAIDFGELALDETDDTTDSSTEEVSFDLGDELELDVDDMLEDVDSDEDDDSVLGMDEVATKLDLAKAYIDMGDPDGARAILDEVLTEGSDDQQSEAKGLIDQL